MVRITDDSNNVLETYAYGASRNRLKNETSTQRKYYAWGENSPIVEYAEATASSTPVYSKSYIYAGSRLVSSATKASATSETWNYHHPDRLGTRLISNPDTVTSYMQSTLPFGTALNAESTGYSNQVFTSYDRSAATGLDYAVNRSYSKGQGRFTQVDPIGIASASLGDPQSNNLYGYVRNMPADFIDPSGLCSFQINWIGWSDGTITYTTTWTSSCNTNSSGQGNWVSGGAGAGGNFLIEDQQNDTIGAEAGGSLGG